MENNQNISDLPIDQILSEFLGEETNTTNEPNKSVGDNQAVGLSEQFSDDSDFFKVLDEKFFKTNKLIPFNNEDGSDYIVPKSYDEFAELIDANKEQWIKESQYQQKEQVLSDIFQESTPAFQFIVQNANMYKSIEDMYPLMQSVQAQDDLQALDVTDAGHQEFIIRTALAIQGYDEVAINEEVEDLRERNKLEYKSQLLKPVLDRIQAERTEGLIQEQQARNQQDQMFWNSYYSNLSEKLIVANNLDGMVLSQEDKIKVANNLIPSSDGSGLPIYSKIDQLVGEGDTVTLSIISMILEDRALFESYYANKSHIKAGQSAARTLRTGVTSKSSEEDIAPRSQQSKGSDPNRSYGVFI